MKPTREEWRAYHRARRQLASAIDRSKETLRYLDGMEDKGFAARVRAEIIFKITNPPIVAPGPRLQAAMMKNAFLRKLP